MNDIHTMGGSVNIGYVSVCSITLICFYFLKGMLLYLGSSIAGLLTLDSFVISTVSLIIGPSDIEANNFHRGLPGSLRTINEYQ